MNKLMVRPRLDFTEGREVYDCPEGVKEYCDIMDGVERTWKEYVPSRYSGSEPVPLVFTLHGGSTRHGADNHHAELSTAWADVAERENFIVVYPQSLTAEHTWSAWEDFNDTERTRGLKNDIVYLDLLVEKICGKYRIDTTRIYLHGQSFGDIMSTFYLLNRPGHPFAAAATLSGPVAADRLYLADGTHKYGRECATPVIRTHGSIDLGMPVGNYQHLNDTVPTLDLAKYAAGQGADTDQIRSWKYELHQLPLIDTWNHNNACKEYPAFSVRGRYNVCSFQGDPDFHFYMVENGGHCPSMDMADFIWTYFFTGWRKVDGRYRKTEPQKNFEPDTEMLALAEGGNVVYYNQKPVGLKTRVYVLDGDFYLTFTDAKIVFQELSFEMEYEGLSVRISGNGHEMQVSANNRTFVWDNHLQHGLRTVKQADCPEILLPVSQIASCFYGLSELKRYEICYLSKHTGQITYDFSRLVKMYTGAEAFPSSGEMIDRITELTKGQPQPGMKD